MSISNYQKCVKLGVTGKFTSTCFPAAVDKILPEHRVSPAYYRAYDAVMKRYGSVQARIAHGQLQSLYEDLVDVLEIEGLEYRRVRTLHQLNKLVHIANESCTPVVLDLDFDTNTIHSVSIAPVDVEKGQYKLYSTHIPVPLRGVVTLEQVFPYVYQPEVSCSTSDFCVANVTLVHE